MPTGMNTLNSAALIRGQVFSQQLKEQLQDDLIMTKYVEWLPDFPDGDVFTLPSIGSDLPVRTVVEDTDIVFDAIDTGEFNFSITEYLASATYVTKKNLQDSFYMNKVQSTFVPSQRRSIMKRVEGDIMNLQRQQIAGSPNLINGQPHRIMGTGAGGTLSPRDFARAKLSLNKANVPLTNLVAIVDGSQGFVLETDANFINFSNNPQWEGIVADGLTTGMRFLKNIYGFDVYESNYTDTNVIESIGGVAATAENSVAMFFSAASGIMPFMGAWRQMPEVDSGWNMHKQREEHITTARYGLKLSRPENLVSVITNTAV